MTSDRLTDDERRDVRLVEGALAAWVAGEDVEFAHHAQALLAIIDRLGADPVARAFGRSETLPEYGCTCP